MDQSQFDQQVSDSDNDLTLTLIGEEPAPRKPYIVEAGTITTLIDNNGNKIGCIESASLSNNAVWRLCCQASAENKMLRADIDGVRGQNAAASSHINYLEDKIKNYILSNDQKKFRITYLTNHISMLNAKIAERKKKAKVENKKH